MLPEVNARVMQAAVQFTGTMAPTAVTPTRHSSQAATSATIEDREPYELTETREMQMSSTRSAVPMPQKEPMELLMSSYIQYLDYTSSKLNHKIPDELRYYVWADTVPSSGEAMLELRIRTRQLSLGTLVLEPVHNDYILPLMKDATGEHKLRLLVIKCNRTASNHDNYERHSTLIVALVQQLDVDNLDDMVERYQQSTNTGLYEVPVSAADTSGVRVFFNEREHTLGRIELSLFAPGALPNWHIKFMRQIGEQREAESMTESLESIRILIENETTGLLAQASVIAARAPPIGSSQPTHSWQNAHDNRYDAPSQRSYSSSLSTCTIS